MSIAGEPRADRSQKRHPSLPSTKAATPSNSRKALVAERLRLNHDLFLYASAENEIQAFPDDFFAYFVKPNEKLWERLLSAHHVFLFGEYGSGKTTLRLNLARHLHHERPDVMAVTCDFGVYAGQGERVFLAEQMAKELLIQTLERLDLVVVEDARNEHVIRHLRGLLYGGLRATVQRVVKGGVEGERIDRRLAGHGREWSDYMQLSPALQEFLQKLLDATQPGQAPPSIAACLEAGKQLQQLQQLQQLGFNQVYVLADGFDAHERSAGQMAGLLDVLVKVALELDGRLLLKAFLPAAADVREAVAPLLDELAAVNGEQAVEVSLFWDAELLGRVLEKRFSAAGRPDLRRLEDLVQEAGAQATLGKAMNSNLPRAVVEAASNTLDTLVHLMK